MQARPAPREEGGDGAVVTGGREDLHEALADVEGADAHALGLDGLVGTLGREAEGDVGRAARVEVGRGDGDVVDELRGRGHGGHSTA